MLPILESLQSFDTNTPDNSLNTRPTMIDDLIDSGVYNSRLGASRVHALSAQNNGQDLQQGARTSRPLPSRLVSHLALARFTRRSSMSAMTIARVCARVNSIREHLATDRNHQDPHAHVALAAVPYS